jgi:hypothetical protein
MKRIKIIFIRIFLCSLCICFFYDIRNAKSGQLTQGECNKYKFNFNDISEVYFPQNPWQEVFNENGGTIMEQKLYFVYNGEKVIPYDIANACFGFAAKGESVKNIPDKCVFLISSQTYWLKKPECAKIKENQYITNTCNFLCAKDKCYAILNMSFLYSGDRGNIPEFDEDKSIPFNFYDENNPCGHKYWQP